jgi:pSer/pThr/pTyr-binding forkhead associated (FHA) protein
MRVQDSEASATTGRAVLVLCDGEFAGAEYPLTGEETLIGRNPTTSITLLDESISREHAIVAWDATTGCYAIEDLQSTNGTRVNGKRVRSAMLADGDEIQVGHTRFRFFLAKAGG